MTIPNKPDHDKRGSEDELLAGLLTAELDKLDGWIAQEPPDAAWFERMVAQEKKGLRRKLIRDLALFWLTALSVFAVYTAVVYGSPALFAVIQLAALAAIPFVVLKQKGMKAGDRL